MNIPSLLKLSVTIERWPIAGSFAISRGPKTEAVVVVAKLQDGGHAGRGECVPYARYGETPEGVAAAIEAMRPALGGGLTREGLQRAMPAGAARNALDCAFWDLQAKETGKPAHELAGLAPPRPLVTAFTISLGTPEEMAQAAQKASRERDGSRDSHCSYPYAPVTTTRAAGRPCSSTASRRCVSFHTSTCDGATCSTALPDRWSQL